MRHGTACNLLLTSALLAMPRPAAAQEGTTCGWHYLETVPRPASIDALAARVSPAEQFDDVVARAVNWFRSCDHADSRVAAHELRRMLSMRRAQGPAVKGLLGTILMRGPDVQVEFAEGAWLRPMHQISNAERDGARLLADVARETGWPEVIQELAAVTVSTRRKQTLSIARDGLDDVPAAARDAAYWAAHAELAYARGDYDDAAESATRAMKDGSARGARILGMSRMMTERDPRPGSDIYLRGLGMSESSRDLHWYYDDIRLLLGADELEQWTSLETGRAQWIRSRWDWRAMQNGIDIADRLAEHNRRLVHILEHFLRLSYRGSAPETSVWQTSPLAWLQPVDDRGIIYLRHGAPAHELILPRRGRFPRLAWAYMGAGPMESVFEFDKSPDRADYFLAEPYPICGNMRVSSGRTFDPDNRPNSGSGFPDSIDAREWSEILGRVSTELAHYYHQCAFGSPFAVTSFMYARDDARRAAVAAWNSETALPPLRSPINSLVNLYAFRTGTGAELIAYVSVPGAPLTPSPATGPITYSLDMRLAAGNPVSGTILRGDTTITLIRQEPLPEASAVGTTVRLDVTPAERTVITLTVHNRFDNEQGQVLATTKAIPDYAASPLMLSDLVVSEMRAGVLRRGAASLAPAPGHVVAANTAFRLFNEVYGVDRNDPLAVQVVIAPSSDSDVLSRLRSLISERTAMTVDFQEAAEPDADGVLRMERDITAELRPGAYRIIITVRNMTTSAEARAETNLIVR